MLPVFPVVHITWAVLLAVAGLGTAAPTAQAGVAGIVESCEVSETPGPCTVYALVYAETAQDFLEQYKLALSRGFVWEEAPKRVYDSARKVWVWRVQGHYDPERELGESSDLPEEGVIDVDGVSMPYVLVTVSAESAEDFITELQTAFAEELIPNTQPVFGPLDCDGGTRGWTMELILANPLLDLPYWGWLFLFP